MCNSVVLYGLSYEDILYTFMLENFCYNRMYLFCSFNIYFTYTLELLEMYTVTEVS